MQLIIDESNNHLVQQCDFLLSLMYGVFGSLFRSTIDFAMVSSWFDFPKTFIIIVAAVNNFLENQVFR